MWPALLILIYCLLVAFASLAGGYLPFLVRLTHRRTQFMMSFVGGLMLGVALLHLLPHAVAETGSVDQTALWAVAGLLAMFFLIRIFQVHQHTPAHPLLPDHHAHDHHEHQHQDVVHHTEHHHHGGAEHLPAGKQAQRMSWVGLTSGLALHTLIDGVALAASVSAESANSAELRLLGASTFLAVLLHKPLDALAITSVMVAGGWSKRKTQLVSTCFALMCPLGAIAFYFGVAEQTAQQHQVVGAALAFAGGVFLCISLADLLPEVQFHSHDRLTLSVLLLLGVATAYAVGFLEPAHVHQSAPTDHQHHHHDPWADPAHHH